MTKKTQPEAEVVAAPHGYTMKSYVIGFVLAVVLTLIAYFVVVNKLLDGFALAATLMGLAAVQFMVQLVFFLHLGQNRKSGPWTVASFYFMIIVLVIVVLGSLWIMHNMNYNMMMTPEQMNEFMLKEAMKGF